MTIPSLEFLVVILLVSAFFSWCGSVHVRRGLLAALSFGFLYALVPNAASGIALAVFLLSGYLVARWLATKPSTMVLGVFLTLYIAAFVILRKYELLDYIAPTWLLEHPIGIVGLSYMLFRQIQYVVDAAQQQIKIPSLWRYLNFQVNIFTILAGPIQRYQNFEDDWGALQPRFEDRHELLKAYLRLLTGILLMVVVAPACLGLYELAVRNTEWDRPARAAAVFYSYPAYVYFNFAGYSSVVIAAGALLGLKLPENFNRPYLARNMLEFWNRWHITLSHWLRDYLFTPMYKALAEREPKRAATLVPVCYFVVFLVAGIWHGTTANFVIFGLLHGMGVSAAKMWENLLIRRGGRKGLRQYMQSRKVRVAATVITFHFACATFLFFPEDLRYCLDVLESIIRGELV